MNDSNPVYEWEARIDGGTGDGSGAFVSFPWDLKECFGKTNLVPIWADFDGEPYRGVINNMGSGPCIIVVKAIREKLGKQDGDRVRVRVKRDTDPRIVEAPDDLKTALAGTPAATVWEAMAPSHRKEYVAWIEGAKREETRAARVAKAVPLIAEKRKLK